MKAKEEEEEEEEKKKKRKKFKAKSRCNIACESREARCRVKSESSSTVLWGNGGAGRPKADKEHLSFVGFCVTRLELLYFPMHEDVMTKSIRQK